MPDARLQRTRATLPTGYQFGDGRLGDMLEIALISRAYAALPLCASLTPRYGMDFSGASSFRAPVRLQMWPVPYETDAEKLERCKREYIDPMWRPMHENAAERIARYQAEYDTGRDCGDEA